MGTPYSPVPPTPAWAGGPARGGDQSQGRTAAWRLPLAIVLLVVGCLAAVPAVAGVWVHRTVMDVDGYVAAVTPVSEEAAVQKAVIDALAGHIAGALDSAGVVVGSLPDDLGSIGADLSAPLKELTRTLTEHAVTSPAFVGLWAAANRAAHPLFLNVIENAGGDHGKAGAVRLDLAAVNTTVVDLLAEAGVNLPPTLPESLRKGQVTLVDSQALADAGAMLRALDTYYLAFCALALAGLVGAVAVARNRPLTGIFAGLGLALAMGALELALMSARTSYLDGSDEAKLPHDAAAAFWDVFTTGLHLWVWVVLGVGLAAAAASAALLVVHRRSH